MEQHFTAPPYTIGIEEELMILDGESLELANAIESLLEPTPAGEIKPELMESVLEISTDPCESTVQAGEQLRALRQQVTQKAASKGLSQMDIVNAMGTTNVIIPAGIARIGPKEYNVQLNSQGVALRWSTV